MIVAPEGAPPGSLSLLTEFLNTHGVRAVPGYYGSEKRHVLRLSHFGSDEALHGLLTKHFPHWLEAQHTKVHPITISPSLALETISHDNAFDMSDGLMNQLVKNSGTITGGIYTLANLCYLGFAIGSIRSTKAAGPVDYSVLASALCFLAGGFVVTAHGNPARGTDNVYPLLSELYERADSAGAQSDTSKGIYDAITHLTKRYPWEIGSIANGLGILLQIRSTYTRAVPIERASGIAFLTSYLIAALVPEKGGRSMINTDAFLGEKTGEDIIQSLDTFRKHSGILQPIVNFGYAVADYIHEKPVQVSGGVALLGNAISMTASQIERSSELTQTANLSKRLGLGGCALFSTVGGGFQLLAGKDRGATFDSVVTSAAEMIRHDPKLQNASHGEVMVKIEGLARSMSESTDIVHDEAQMRRGIIERLKRDADNSCLTMDECLVGFLPSEQKKLEKSPFINTQLVKQLAA